MLTTWSFEKNWASLTPNLTNLKKRMKSWKKVSVVEETFLTVSISYQNMNERGYLRIFHHFWLMMVCQVFLISLMFSLKKSKKYFLSFLGVWTRYFCRCCSCFLLNRIFQISCNQLLSEKFQGFSVKIFKYCMCF